MKNYTSKKSYKNYKNHKNKARGHSTPSQAERTEEKCAATAARRGRGGRRREQTGKGCGSAAARAHGADSDAECRNKDLLRAAVLRATAVAVRDDGFARGRDASGETAREERGLFSVSFSDSGAVE